MSLLAPVLMSELDTFPLSLFKTAENVGVDLGVDVDVLEELTSDA